MNPTRALGTALAAAAVAGLLAGSARAVALPRPASDASITTAHFVVHYYTDVSAGSAGADYTSATQAGDVAGYAEQAYALESSWGYPAPVNDGDGHIDIYLDDLSSTPGVIGMAEPDGATPYPSPDSGAIVLATPTQMQAFATQEGLTLAQEEEKTIAHELFHLYQFATWVPTGTSDDWLLEGSAQWAGFEAIGYPAGDLVTDIGPADIALDCDDAISGQMMCDTDPYVEGGYSRWAFFQLLANQYGPSFMHGVFVNLAAGQTAEQALGNALSAKGTSLSSEFATYANALMDGGFGVQALASLRPAVQAAIMTGTQSSTLSTESVAVNHLSVRYLTFQRGDGDGSHACYAASLTINVTIPSGVSSQPAFFWDVAGSSPQPLSVNGSAASITVPWDTCDWGSTRGWLSLPNGSTSVDGATFTVASSVTVDPTTPASATAAPGPVSIWGTTMPVPTTDVAPLIQVYGPELLRVSAGSPWIRLIVQSDGPGTLNAALGAAVLGQRGLRAGNNDLRYLVPKSLLGSLRHSTVVANLLTLTPASPSGAVRGQPITRRIVITAVTAKHHVAKKHTK